jgi:methyl-accepting chemotaxis protein
MESKARVSTRTSELATDLPMGQLLRTLRSFRKGDFTVRLPLDYSGVAGEIAQALNDVIELNESMSRELRRINTVVGKEGKLGASSRSTASSRIWCSRPPRSAA